MESGFIIIVAEGVQQELFWGITCFKKPRNFDWDWVDDSRKALRFSREQDAKVFVEVLRMTGVLTMPVKILEYHWS